MKFKKGDIVKGINNRIYSITNEDMTKGVVVYVGSYDEDEIEIKVLEHKTKPEEIGHSFFVKSKFLELYDDPKIVITADGNKTFARLYENDKVVRTAELKCSLKEAFERLIEKKKEFVPYLKDEDTGELYGKIGAPTKMKDIDGEPLFVGDVVELTLKGKRTCGNEYIVEYYDKHFVMGIINDCDDNGKISDRWIVIKRKGYEELENGEEYDDIKAILEESKQSSEVIS